MDYDFYLDKFKKAAKELDTESLHQKRLEIDVGVILNSVYLKLYKKDWTNDKADPLNARTRIFFSIWVNDKAIKEKRIFYNIHALKLRELKGYSIQSREFAAFFRKDFREFQREWENISVDFGPLTLMEGWVELDVDTIENSITTLSNNFLQIERLIDKTLERFKD